VKGKNNLANFHLIYFNNKIGVFLLFAKFYDCILQTSIICVCILSPPIRTNITSTASTIWLCRSLYTKVQRKGYLTGYFFGYVHALCMYLTISKYLLGTFTHKFLID